MTRDRAALLLNSRSVAERKCDIAEKDTDRFKVDDGCPDLKEAYLYYIKVYEGKQEGTTKSHSKKTVHRQDVDDEQGRMLARRLAPKAKLPQQRGPPAKASCLTTGTGDPASEEADIKAQEAAAAAAEIARQNKAK